jgi:tetratricopeptide (TPR) repeat protein
VVIRFAYDACRRSGNPPGLPQGARRKHSHIAHVLYDAVLRTQDQRFDNLIRILSKLNPGYTYDLEVLARLVKAENVENTVSDPHRGRQVYEVALGSAGRRAVILHQCGIYEMHISNDIGELRGAEEFILEALSVEPHNQSIKHSLAELDLRRSRLAKDPLERISWRRSAIERAKALTVRTNNSYPYTTLVKAGIDDIRDALPAAESNDDEASVRRLGDSIAATEEVLRGSLQLFPNDPVLLTLEGELSSALSQAERAENSFRRAFEANPRSTLVARRLARIQRSKGAYSDAVSTLRRSLEANPSSRELQFELASSLMEAAPNADQTNADEILYHLQRSFSPGDRNYQAQFLFARQLCIVGRYDDATAIFARLREVKVSFQQKVEARAYLRDADGRNLRFEGTLITLKPSFGFVKSDRLKLSAYFEVREAAMSSSDVSIGASVSFDLAFNLRGPVATEVRLTGASRG